MKYLWTFSIIILISCQNKSNQLQELTRKVDSLQIDLKNAYRPGFGSSMNWVQHHFEEIAIGAMTSNWPYAAFEIKEMEEAFGNIAQYQKERKETALLYMISQPIMELKLAVKNTDSIQFKKAYQQVWQTCNKCHMQTGYGFIKIKNSYHD